MDTKTKVLIATTSFGKDDASPMEALHREGFQIITNTKGRKLEREELLELAKDCEGIIAGTEKYDETVIAWLPKLKAISRCGAGMDNVDFKTAEKRGILVSGTPEAPVEAVAELAVALMLCTLRKIPQMERNVKAGMWKKEMGFLLQGKKVGIIGFGRIGRRVAELIKAFGAVAVAFDPYADVKTAEKMDVKLFSKEGGLEKLLEQSDIITIHAPYSKENENLLGKKELMRMKLGAVLVNTARGGLVDEKELRKALENGKIGAAALDVTAEEPYNGPLARMENVVLTPHIGSYAREARVRMETEAVSNLVMMLKKGKK